MSTGRSSDTRAAVTKYSRSDSSSYTICIARPPNTYDGRTSTGYPIRVATADRLVDARRRAVLRLPDLQLARDLLEALAIFGDVDRVRRRSEDPNAGGLQRPRELERRLATQLHDDAFRLLAPNDLEHVLERQRLEVQLVRDVVVGRDGLGIRVDHDRLVPRFAERHHRAHAAVVELDALPDAIRSTPENHDRTAAGLRRLALLVVRAVQVRRLGRETPRRTYPPSCTTDECLTTNAARGRQPPSRRAACRAADRRSRRASSRECRPP